MNLTPKNWGDFQHYKDRAPPWIKLHKGLLDDSAFQRLPTASRALAPMLWLLASEQKDGSFNADHAELAFRLRQTEKEIKDALTPLISKGFFLVLQDASETIAQCKPDAMPETEERQRTETEGETEKSTAIAFKTFPHGLEVDAWQSWLSYRKGIGKPLKPASWDAAQRAMAAFGDDQAAVVAQSIANGYQGLFAIKGKAKQAVSYQGQNEAQLARLMCGSA
ncbi:hypothetical protein [Undibacterium sp.]|uniref:hypothetical protein n=1 Tax=Undibacterium sp. TaxID=1914977 RepID=UPI003750582D